MTNPDFALEILVGGERQSLDGFIKRALLDKDKASADMRHFLERFHQDFRPSFYIGINETTWSCDSCLSTTADTHEHYCLWEQVDLFLKENL